MKTPTLEEAFAAVQKLVADFRANETHYLSPAYQESEVRTDFISKLFIALGWDVNHDWQKNPFQQEVKVERGVSMGASQRRADYAFYIAPNFRDVRFFVKAKKPFGDIATPDNCFQAIRYGWNAQTPVAVLTDFEQFQILDCRTKPDIDAALNQILRKYHYSDYAGQEKFAEIFYLFSREAVAGGSLEKFAETLPRRRGKAAQRGLLKGGYQSIDDAFLEELDECRDTLARAFKNRNPDLDGETLTEITQRVIDRLVFIRFLEDKMIHQENLVANFGDKGTAWQDFIAASRRFDAIYNGIVFKRHDIVDAPGFQIDDAAFANICGQLAHVNSPYDFNAIPIHILGSIYERFLGKIIITTDHRARVEEKPAVRKAGGVYYTPEYIVRYIVENTVGKLIEGKSPAQIAGMRFADIACGSGSFLLGVYDVLLRYFRDWHNARPKDAAKAGCVQRNDGAWHLSLHQRREILINNIYGVDIDRQAVEVAQLSLYLKLLEEETTATARAHQLEFHETLLPPLNKNIVCGNSLIGTDILSGQLLEPVEEKKLNPMDFEQRFPEVMKRGGFDAIVGNPPWGVNLKVAERNYLIQKSVEVADFESSQYFLVRCNSLLNPRGLLGAIVPNTFVLNVFAKKCRDRLLAFFALQSILDLSDGDVFLGPSVRSLVTIFSRNKREDCQILRLSSETNAAHQIHTVSQKELSDAETWKGFLAERTPQAELVIRLVQNKPSLADFFEARQGYIPYRTTTLTRRYGAIKAREIVKNRLWHGNKRVDSTCQKELQGVDVGRFSLNWSGVWVQYGEWVSTHLPLTVFSGPRVLIREITGRHPHALSATFTDEVFVHNPSVLAVLPRYTSISPKFAVGILNSRLLSLVFSQVAPKAEKGLFPKIIITDAKRLPFPAMNLEDKATKVRHDRMVSLVDQMLSAKRHLAAAKSDGDKDFYGAKCAALDRQIDALVYELYGLTPEEIQIVEGALLHEL